MKKTASKRSGQAAQARPNPTELKVGPEGRSVFIFDDVVGPEEAVGLYKFFRNLPYRFVDSDRFDTREYRHFGYRFEVEPVTDHPVIGFFANVATSHLRFLSLNAGRVKRAYANLNLYGDVQFAHEDGDEWSALVFVNETWNADWAGELLVYADPSQSLAYAIRPAPGRMVVFDGLLTHRGGVPSKLTTEPRITLAIKIAR